MKPVKCILGWHGPLISGVGGMGDAILCLSCGHESYVWPPGTSSRSDCREVTRELWPEIEKARNLPRGINTLAKKPDPEFDAWLKRGRWPKS